MSKARDNETLAEYWERTQPSVYARIDRLQIRGFAGLMVAGASPIVGDVISGWLGWPMFIGGAAVVVYSMVEMGKVR